MQPTGKSKVKFSSILLYILIGIVFLLTHFWLMFPFYTPWKLQKTWFSGVFKGYKMGTLARNGSAFKIQVLSTSAIKCRGDFRNFQFASEIRRQKNCRRLSRNLCILRRLCRQHASAFCQGLWFSFLIDESTCPA